ncbi:hypothetical protein E2562_001750 [Oryza meyeriana var. granulata]|uniref:Uncharacterized protein n=1 Tax=Oryza meyeriana var. granulata TaxID=110450 RepID=A0A6G1CE97_9ORYZ|nr:hypothetical protein E2562_001750 [Oryza meyeriana var. granulata]
MDMPRTGSGSSMTMWGFGWTPVPPVLLRQGDLGSKATAEKVGRSGGGQDGEAEEGEVLRLIGVRDGRERLGREEARCEEEDDQDGDLLRVGREECLGAGAVEEDAAQRDSAMAAVALEVVQDVLGVEGVEDDAVVHHPTRRRLLPPGSFTLAMDSHDVRVRLHVLGGRTRCLASGDLGDPHQHLAFLLPSANGSSPKPASGHLDIIATTCMPTSRIRRAYSAAARSTSISPSSSTLNTRARSSAHSASCSSSEKPSVRSLDTPHADASTRESSASGENGSWEGTPGPSRWRYPTSPAASRSGRGLPVESSETRGSSDGGALD